LVTFRVVQPVTKISKMVAAMIDFIFGLTKR